MLSEPEIVASLSYVAVEQQVAASTHYPVLLTLVVRERVMLASAVVETSHAVRAGARTRQKADDA